MGKGGKGYCEILVGIVGGGGGEFRWKGGFGWKWGFGGKGGSGGDGVSGAGGGRVRAWCVLGVAGSGGGDAGWSGVSPGGGLGAGAVWAGWAGSWLRRLGRCSRGSAPSSLCLLVRQRELLGRWSGPTGPASEQSLTACPSSTSCLLGRSQSRPARPCVGGFVCVLCSRPVGALGSLPPLCTLGTPCGVWGGGVWECGGGGVGGAGVWECGGGGVGGAGRGVPAGRVGGMSSGGPAGRVGGMSSVGGWDPVDSGSSVWSEEKIGGEGDVGHCRPAMMN